MKIIIRIIYIKSDILKSTKQDVAAAVFMATATAVPELCTNTISIFIADSDMGLGTIIGSLVWNVLGVAALASIATTKVRPAEKFSITSLNEIHLICSPYVWIGYR